MDCGRYAFLFSPSMARSQAEESKIPEEIKHLPSMAQRNETLALIEAFKTKEVVYV